ncbi:MotB family protein [Labrenzia sp. 011]|uniref:MotB family protein n=1 Tax=Labrenzia sp. 011 TaxID=2171494 RepID=UPI000D51731B|nr:MotB family protein [Labrenzia sp. 011]PVB62685.1 MotB family protein [Labrenzia sp. 011]
MIDGVPSEIVIVRRKNNWDEESHSHGVWKIAYADFMTALMAFFLVMWLINVTDESVRKGVAQYFNPVKLASTAPNRKGLNDPNIDGETSSDGVKLFNGKLGGSDEPVDQDPNFGEGLKTGHEAVEVEETPAQGDSSISGQFTQIHAESILFSDPYAVLDTLSEKIRVLETQDANPLGIGSGMQKHEGVQGGQAYRDPFDPLYWQFRPGRGVDGAAPLLREQALREEGMQEKGTGTGPSEVKVEGRHAWGVTKNENLSGETDGGAGAAEMDGNAAWNGDLQHASGSGPEVFAELGEGPHTDPFKKMDPLVAHVTGLSLQNGSQAMGQVSTGTQTLDTGTEVVELEASGEVVEGLSNAEIIVARLSEVLETTKGTVLEETARQITVKREGEGALISLTDDQNFGMFAIGSAEPRPELVKLLERIGKVVAGMPGQIVIKGHTDARPFRSKTYDNWRLSSARAHMALYMLTRGGVAKDRFDRVEGYADRHLKNPNDPFAASNRRIEIYLLEGAE